MGHSVFVGEEAAGFMFRVLVPDARGKCEKLAEDAAKSLLPQDVATGNIRKPVAFSSAAQVEKKAREGFSTGR